MVLLEIAPGKPSDLSQASNVLKALVKSLNPKLDCMRLSMTLVWKNVDALTKLSCDYTKAGCFQTALARISELQKKESSNPEYVKKYNTVNLINAIDVAQVQLNSGG